MRKIQVIVFLLTACLSVSAWAATDNKYTGKYANYEFTPEYGTAKNAETLPFYDKLQTQLQPWHQPNIYFALRINNSVIYMYQAKIQSAKAGEFILLREKERKQRKHVQPASWGAILVYYNGHENELIHFEKLNLLPGPDYTFDPYGCPANKPLFKTALAGHKDYLWAITGKGWLNDIKDFPYHTDYIKLHLYEPVGFSQVFEVPLVAYNLIRRHSDNGPGSQFLFPSATANLSRPGHKLTDPIGSGLAAILPKLDDEGRKLYSKVFVKDFNKDDKLDILIWQRGYRSRRMDETGDNWKLDTNRFKWYEEADDGVHFAEKPVSEAQGAAWLKQYDLSWKDGYPRAQDNQCTGSYKAIPFINTTKDPVIQQAP